MTKDGISLITKRKLASSLKKFMAKKDFDKITIREILEDADMSRSTFYYHFEDVYDLMKWTFDTELVALLEKSEDCVTWDDGMLLVFQYVEKNRKICLCAYNSVGRDMLYRLFSRNVQGIMGKFANTLSGEISAQPEHIDFIVGFYTSALISALVEWMITPNGRSPEDMIALIDMAVHGSVEAALRRSAESEK